MLFWSAISPLIRLVFLFFTFATWHTAHAIKCYSCANDFIVWQWRHFFLKRNYDISTSDPECTSRDYISDLTQSCHSTCFVFYLNGTNKETGHTKVLGVGRGCSASFLTDDQHLHLGLGAHSRPSHVGEYLPHDFDQFDITEHWCFCATEKCNSEDCFSSPFGSREYASSYIAKRLQYSSSYSHNQWRYRNTGSLCTLSFVFMALLLVLYTICL
ncbi:Homolog of Odr-2 (Two) [Caenorhabditis elegans]|uniref:Homolog of Odr-2 (Two) n=1 Tax=Caenorhabditis elegans TaxID=6239 RepID=G4SDZ8_CAEEL|nr:Homolog of Odr-2 (Two) [Caenorhabditis elegans]CCD69556.1 Homolog of Odr-2 (Two) [Caenorhabditis elegans]|eukprot:NP_001255996.1 Uncharacterized protein CELE_F16B3.3 [Caenorhabditis elegans]